MEEVSEGGREGDSKEVKTFHKPSLFHLKALLS
jgi:hypothetical protein